MNELIQKLKEIRIVPVVKIDDAKKAVPLAKSLIEGGIPCAEVTFRTEGAKEAIKEMHEAYPDMLIGAGTVLNAKQVDEAIEAGATFIVSPGLNPNTVKYCKEKGIPILPGVATASEIEQAIELGLCAVKFFPAEANGGLKTLKALSAPYYKMEFMPTGGIQESNVKEYLAFDKVIACGGSWMVKDELIENEKFEEIQALAQKAMALVTE